VDGHHVRADAVDLRPHLDQQARQVLNVGLGCRVRDRCRSFGQRRGHQRVLGGHHRWLVHEDPARCEPLLWGGDLHPARAADQGAHVAEGIEVRVEAPPADGVPSRRWHVDVAESREKRARQEERGADRRCKLLVDLGPGHGVGLEPEVVVARPGRLHAEPLQQRHLRLRVPDPRHVGEHELLVGEQAGGHDRERRVLVARSGDLAGQGGAPLDHELLHQLRRSVAIGYRRLG
jgi:hypothetical protein